MELLCRDCDDFRVGRKKKKEEEENEGKRRRKRMLDRQKI
jgi:hypothetical protein